MLFSSKIPHNSEEAFLFSSIWVLRAVLAESFNCFLFNKNGFKKYFFAKIQKIFLLICTSYYFVLRKDVFKSNPADCILILSSPIGTDGSFSVILAPNHSDSNIHIS